MQERRVIGEFASMCANSLELTMRREADKMPTGETRNSEVPMPAYRWMSSRSVLIAWMFTTGLGLKPGKLTSTNQVRMDRICQLPSFFLRRFVQGISDSDGTVRNRTLEIASMPNAEFVAKLLVKLGLISAHTLGEKELQIRTSAGISEAAALPIFNESAKGYRYKLMMKRTEESQGLTPFV